MLMNFEQQDGDGGAACLAALRGERVQYALSDQSAHLVLVFESGHGLMVSADLLSLKLKTLPTERCAEILAMQRIRVVNEAAAVGFSCASALVHPDRPRHEVSVNDGPLKPVAP